MNGVTVSLFYFVTFIFVEREYFLGRFFLLLLFSNSSNILITFIQFPEKF